MDESTTPPSIKQHKYKFLFEPEWQMLHNYKFGNSLGVFCGGLGSGKTYAALKRGEIIGVSNTRGDFLFDAEHLSNHVCFDKEGFDKITDDLNKLPAFKTKGYCVILDEAEIDLYNKDFQKQTVKDLTMKFATIRSKRYCLGLTLPAFGMLNFDIRRLVNYYCQMLRIDLKHKQSFSTFNFVKANPYSGQIYRSRPVLFKEVTSSLTGLPVRYSFKLGEVAWSLPKGKVIDEYEKLKEEFLVGLYSKQRGRSEEALIVPERKKVKSVEGLVVAVLESPDKYKSLGRFDWSKIHEGLGCSQDMAKSAVKRLKERVEVSTSRYN